LQDSEKVLTFANAIKIVVGHSEGRTLDAQQNCRAFFMLSEQPIKTAAIPKE
jgi:hypothetical protein